MLRVSGTAWRGLGKRRSIGRTVEVAPTGDDLIQGTCPTIYPPPHPPAHTMSPDDKAGSLDPWTLAADADTSGLGHTLDTACALHILLAPGACGLA